MRKHTFVILAYQESDDLEECIKSILKQSVKSNVILATSTPNDYILDLASEYALGVMINDQEGKGSDYNFALETIDSELITIAHQDDIYNRNYAKEVLKAYKKQPHASILFTDNYQIMDDKKITKNKELREKRYHLFPLKYALLQNKKYFKMRSVRRKKYICTSSITFVNKNISKPFFPLDFVYNNDWQALINLAMQPSYFVFIDQKLVGYRLSKKKIDYDKIVEDRQILKNNYPKWYYEKIIRKSQKNFD